MSEVSVSITTEQARVLTLNTDDGQTIAQLIQGVVDTYTQTLQQNESQAREQTLVRDFRRGTEDERKAAEQAIRS